MKPIRPLIHLALALGALACADDAQSDKRADTPKQTLAPDASAKFEPLSVSPGSIAGVVLFEGTPPTRTPINTAAEGGCGIDPNEPALSETWVVDGGRMANVFVWLAKPPSEVSSPALSKEPHLLRQRGCIYRPHAIGLRVGETLRITNEDRARHNVRTLPRRDQNPSINQTQVEGAPPIELLFASPEVAVPIVCDLHPWMKAWVGVFEHPYFAVTGADGGFAWSGLPPGEYEVRAWHEVLGRLSTSAVVTGETGAQVRIIFRKKD